MRKQTQADLALGIEVVEPRVGIRSNCSDKTELRHSSLATRSGNVDGQRLVDVPKAGLQAKTR